MLSNELAVQTTSHDGMIVRYGQRFRVCKLREGWDSSCPALIGNETAANLYSNLDVILEKKRYNWERRAETRFAYYG